MSPQIRHMLRSSPSCRLVLMVLLIAACERETRTPATDSAPPAAPVPPDSVPLTSTRATWDPMLGPVLVIAGDGQQNASVVFPMFSDSTLTDTTTFDTSILSGMNVDLFSRAGRSGTGRLRAAKPRTRDGCVAWPEAAVTVADSAGRDGAWTVGLASGHASPLALDSLERLTGADSARLTADVARLASAVPADTAAAFHGIPFFVRQVWRFRTAAGTDVLVANVTRRINQEANPREEQLLLLAERDGNRPDSRYATAYHERVSGHEEAIETTDVLAAITLAGGLPAIVLLRDYGDGSAYALLTRTPSGEWRIGWSSAYAGC
jgi:hypothetical protein